MYPSARRERPRATVIRPRALNQSQSEPGLLQQSNVEAGAAEIEFLEGSSSDCGGARNPKHEPPTSLGGFLIMKEKKEERKLEAWLKTPAHLRPAPSPTEMGCMPNYVTETMRGLTLPVQKAVDPKWSTELKKVNAKVGACIKYQNSISSSMPGQISPELPFMWKKDYLSNPPTPYFEPGRRPVHPADRLL
mmetsp:Transcript_1320/g.3023  ORF Transcript_1320/g.3023 Transcript_1320/m.3023 type:complete len:191 (-) Transcript_1320:135-707(-)